jgi:uroporphyrin-III C-methyltransferase
MNDLQNNNHTKGKVYLVGAGPGNPKLLTVRALEVFEIVDVALYDRLVSKEILDLIPERVRKIDVGKTPQCEGITQGDINQILVKEARSGHNVMRLKGGDPLLFSRGEEELEVICAEGIAYEIVPGISAAIGVPSFAGIPLTRRGISSSVAIVTGHEDPTKENSSVDFERLATAAETIVVLMGKTKLRQISEQLIKGGARDQTPVAIVESGTRPTQRVSFSTLGGILEDRDTRIDSQPPALIVIGDIVRTALALQDVKMNATELDQLPIAWCAAAEFS